LFDQGRWLWCFHVYRSGPQSRLAPGHPVARELSRGGKGQEAHPVEPLRLAARADRRVQGTAQRRHRHSQDQDAITIIRSLPHGHVEAALGTARKIGLDRLLGPDGNRCRDLILALVVNRILDPGSKLAAARALSPDTATSSLGEQLALGVVDEDELYSALDWLAVRQPSIEAALAKRHFTGGTLVLYDVSSSYLEGRCCPLAQFGYSRDGKRGKLQIVYGLALRS
jgi:hypothetical protein